MRPYVTIIKNTRLQEWPYPEMKQASNQEIDDWYWKEGFKGNSWRSLKIDTANKNTTYYQIGSGMVGIAFGYIMGWMLIILFLVFFVYKIMHHGGVH